MQTALGEMYDALRRVEQRLDQVEETLARWKRSDVETFQHIVKDETTCGK